MGFSEQWSNGLKLKEGFESQEGRTKTVYHEPFYEGYPLLWFPMLQSSNTPWPRPIARVHLMKANIYDIYAGHSCIFNKSRYRSAHSMT
ncbi:MAG: hypothetical protein DRG87_07335 [Deltaproteobacteria bacterium]|nr:MAG: hypothetical protein DRG87_07335 [Deltaproteobacteria bacterium]